MNITDTFLVITLLTLVTLGIYQGFLRSLIGPGCGLLSILTAGICYAITRNALAATIIIIAGPFLAGWMVYLVLEIRSKETPPAGLSLRSRLGGAAVHALWGSFSCLALMAAAIVLPLSKFNLGDITDDVLASRTYAFLKSPFASVGVIPRSEAENCLDDTCSMAKTSGNTIIQDKDVQNLINSSEFQELLSDPVIRNALERRDLQALISNPAIIKLQRNPEFIAKVLRIYPKIMIKKTP